MMIEQVCYSELVTYPLIFPSFTFQLNVSPQNQWPAQAIQLKNRAPPDGRKKLVEIEYHRKVKN